MTDQPPESLVRGCNDPISIGVLSDWIEEQYGIALDYEQSGWCDGYRYNFGNNYCLGYSLGDGNGWGNGWGNYYGSGYGDGAGSGFENDGNGNGHGNGYTVFAMYTYGYINGNGQGTGFSI